MKTMRTAFLLVLIFCFSISNAQIASWEKKGYPAASMGVGYMYPKLKSGAETSSWRGFNYRYSILNFFVYSGEVTYEDNNYLHTTNMAYSMFVGMQAHLPVLKLGIGNKKKYGFMLNPFVDIGTAAMAVNVGNKNNSSPIDNWANSYTAALGLEFHMPMFSIGAKYSWTYNMFSSKVSDVIQEPMSQKIGLLSTGGWIKYPTITFQINSLTNLLRPEMKKIGMSYNNGHRTELVSEHYEYSRYNGATWLVRTYREYWVAPTWDAIYSKIINSYIGAIGGTSFRLPNQNQGATLMPFFGANLRFGCLGVDWTYNKGKMALVGPDGMNVKNNYNGSLNSLNIGVDVWGILSSLVFYATTDIMEVRNPFLNTGMVRLMFGKRFSIANLNPEITDKTTIDASAKFGNLSYNPDVYSNKKVKNMYLSLEYANMALYCNFLKKDYFNYSKGYELGLSWHFPIISWRNHKDKK